MRPSKLQCKIKSNATSTLCAKRHQSWERQFFDEVLGSPQHDQCPPPSGALRTKDTNVTSQ